MLEEIISRQRKITSDPVELDRLDLPTFDSYAICNLRGGVGKTSLAFNLSYLTDNLLVIDTCPQGNLSFFYNKDYETPAGGGNVASMIYPYVIPGMGKPHHLAAKVGATNAYFEGKDVFYVPSSSELYTLPSQLITALSQADSLPPERRTMVRDSILLSLRSEIQREMAETHTKRCLIDTSPFFSGATHLSWLAAQALIVPVRTDKQSVNSLKLLLETLTSPYKDFNKFQPSTIHMPKIQMIVLTHCGWSTRNGDKNVPNKQTKQYLSQIYGIVDQHISLFSTDNPENHIVMLDDFLGCGRIASMLSAPIDVLRPGQTAYVERVKAKVNMSVEKIKKELHFISNSLWT